jgi:hypothetical protein
MGTDGNRHWGRGGAEYIEIFGEASIMSFEVADGYISRRPHD